MARTIATIRLVLLTGQRVQEILRARWDQIDFGEKTWTFARSQTKTKRPHLLPITPMIVEALRAIPGVSLKEMKRIKTNALCCGGVILAQGKDDLVEDVQARNVGTAVSA